MSEIKKLGTDSLKNVWGKVFSLIKIITGNVDVKGKGNLQEQVDVVRNIVDGKSDKGHTHTAATITQDGNYRFSTDAERNRWNGTYEQATGYTDQAIADLIGSAPTTLDTLEEIAKAMEDNESVVKALNDAIGTKANQAELDTHTGNGTIHVKASERTAWNAKQDALKGAATTITNNNLTASRALIANTDGKIAVSTTTSTELNRLSGVTSNVQTQLNGKQPTISGAATTITNNNLTASRALVSNSSGKVGVSDVTDKELGYLDGVTGNVQTQLNGKQPTIIGAATTITNNNLTASRALIANTNGKIAVSEVTSTELNRLSGVTGNVQGQIDALSSILGGLLVRQSFSDVPNKITGDNIADFILRNSDGMYLGMKNNPNQSYIIFCQYRGSSTSPDGSSVWSLKISDTQAKVEKLASVGDDYPYIGLSNPSYNAYVRRSGGSGTCYIDIAILRTR